MAITPQALGDLQQALAIVTAQATHTSAISVTERQIFAQLREETQRLTLALETLHQHRQKVRQLLEQALHQVVADAGRANREESPTVQSVHQLLVRLGA